MTRIEIDNWIKDNNIKIGEPLNSGIPRIIKNKYLGDFQRETNYNSDNPTELLYLYLNPSASRVCEVCGKPVKFQNFYNGYKKACCSKCAHELTKIKGKETLQERYNVDNAAKIQKPKKALTEEEKKVKAEKYKQTCLEKYGVDNPMKMKAFKEKLKQTNLERFGVENAAKADSSKEKMKKTCQERYGADWYTQTEEAKEKFRVGRKNDLIERIFNNDRLLNIEPLFTLEEYKGVRTKDAKPIYYRFRCKECGYEFEAHMNNGIVPICRHCHPYITETGVSEEEKDLRAFIESIYKGMIIYNDRGILRGSEIDIYIPRKNLAIEFDGVYWHTEERGKDKFYHLKKSIECNSKGIRLIHIFSDEWEQKKEIVCSIIKSALGIYDEVIYARDCEVATNKNVHKFLNENHLQGACNSSAKYSLVYKGEIVSVLTLSSSRFNKGYDWEILRFANKLNTRVVGGFTRLLSHFRRDYKGSIITYSDRRLFTGDVYRKNGFKEELPTEPNYFYTKGYERLPRQAFQKHKLILQYPEYENLTEKQITQILGYYRIYDCGNWKFTLN